MLCEFLAIHYCSDPIQCAVVLEDVLEVVRRRVELGQGVLGGGAYRTVWAMPCTDPSIVQLWEQLGGCVAGTEYLISHSRYRIRTDGAPLRALAEAVLNDPCIGTTAFRARRVVEEVRKYQAEGVIIPSIFGASHCSYEIREITSAVHRQCGVPVLSFEVPFSSKGVSDQVMGRLQAFAELLEQRRKKAGTN
jgi:benzoyl-CoA reductase/2-hydroxyglutaryl-CoA dehydratase subunit BcrC/BadD/HgdB